MAEAVRIASTWPRCVAIEIEGVQFVALWGAWNRTSDTVIVYDEYVAPLGSLPAHAEAVRKRGKWIPALFDLEARGRAKQEGLGYARRLSDLGIDIYDVSLSEGAGVLAVLERTETHRLQAVGDVTRWRTEYETQRYDEDDKLPKKGGLLMRATALLIQYGRDVGITENRAAIAEGEDA